MPEKREISDGRRCGGPGFSSPTPLSALHLLWGWEGAGSGRGAPPSCLLNAPLTLCQVAKQLSDPSPWAKHLAFTPRKHVNSFPTIAHLFMGWMLEIKKTPLTSASPTVQEGRKDLLRGSRHIGETDLWRGAKTGSSGNTKEGGRGARPG